MMGSLLSFSSIFSYVGYILIAILVLLFMILIHELGHYVAGKILKFKINEFSVGFGPKILQKTKKNGEKISLRAIPLGGYCAFEGEDDDSQNPEAFNNQKPWKRLIVLFSGAFFNFLSAILFSFILLASFGYDYVQVKSVQPESINYSYLMPGDVIMGVDGHKIDFVDDDYLTVLIEKEIKQNYAKNENIITDHDYSYKDDGKQYYMSTEKIPFMIKRDGKMINQDVKINVVYSIDGKYAGWSLLATEEETNEFEIETYKYSIGEALKEAVPFTFKWAWKVLVIFGELITGQLSIKSIGGPITTINMIATNTRTNFSSLFVMIPLIAVNLAVFNLLPIPALDGCQMLFTGVEWASKKKIKRSVINTINTIGLLVLFGFVIIVDILQFIL